MTTDIGLMVILSISLLAFITLFAVVVYQNDKHKKKMEEIMVYEINVNSTIDSSIPQVLDLIITECFRDYRIKFLDPLEEGFITEQREYEIREELVFIVTSRISNAALDKVSLFYNMGSIASILADKIYIIVMNYCVEHNRALGMESN